MPANKFSSSFLLPKYWVIWFSILLLRILSFAPYHLKFKIGRTIGNIIYRVAKPRRQLALKNIAMCFPTKTSSEHHKILREHFESLGINLMETGIALWGKHRNPNSQTNELEHFSYKGLEHIENNKDHGVLILAPHFTTLEITGLMLSFVTKFHSIYRPHNNPLMNYLIIKSRTVSADKNDREVTPISNKNTRGLIKALRNKENITILPDQKFKGKNTVDVPFFGMLAPSNPGVNKLAKMGRAKVLPVFTRRIGSKYQLTILPALENFPSGDDYADTLRLHKLYEEEIQQNPAQYLWTHNRWNVKF